jgi:hypothetical protein
LLHYDRTPVRPYPLTATLRATTLSVRSPQLRYLVKGTKGTFIKYGLDVQEDQLKQISAPSAILAQSFGKEPESIWGTLELVSEDETDTNKSVYVFLAFL